MKIRAETKIIRSARSRVGIDDDKSLAELIGIPYPTFRYRLKRPETWRNYELKALIKVTHMADEDIVTIVKGGMQ